MMELEAMKSYIRENNLTHLVKELVTETDMDVASAVEYVYDMKSVGRCGMDILALTARALPASISCEPRGD